MNLMQAQLKEPEVAEENRQPTTKRTKDIALRLSRLRQQRAINQRDFCQQLDISQPMMSHYERGERRIPSDLLVEMAKILCVSADELLGLKAVKKNALEMDDETKKLWKKFQQFNKLPEHDQRAVTRLINSLSRTKKAS
ncbi:helix-turn-helix protein [Synechococcus sp. Ace-Pa]|uniref:helix-turn-helix domain-containing protein n=1 Tax=Synechococcus sp. Ace-Pa TaxID=2572902 RepID=UPI0011A15CA2|nr:helix-turn-helix transcriptional regulator [Synechococcus sp. Ace-Pa]TWB87045.1 helix-turn-helix protein [Synechococcus sp. Ace-Pa]